MCYLNQVLWALRVIFPRPEVQNSVTLGVSKRLKFIDYLWLSNLFWTLKVLKYRLGNKGSGAFCLLLDLQATRPLIYLNKSRERRLLWKRLFVVFNVWVHNYKSNIFTLLTFISLLVSLLMKPFIPCKGTWLPNETLVDGKAVKWINPNVYAKFFVLQRGEKTTLLSRSSQKLKK